MKRIIRGLGIVVMSACLAGCEQFSFSFGLPKAPAPAPAEDTPEQKAPSPRPLKYMADSAIQGEAGGSDALGTALELSRKYAEVAEQLLEAQKAQKALAEESKQLQVQTARLEGELSQARKELNDANEQIMEQKRMLQQWRDNVLGFRKEMQLAQQTELDALRKILLLLGGQVETAKEGPADTPASTAEGISSDASQKQSS